MKSIQVNRGYAYFRGVRLLFLLNLPGGTLIKGGMFIPDPRVHTTMKNDLLVGFQVKTHYILDVLVSHLEYY